jgi:hypothetical protein
LEGQGCSDIPDEYEPVLRPAEGVLAILEAMADEADAAFREV